MKTRNHRLHIHRHPTASGPKHESSPWLLADALRGRGTPRDPRRDRKLLLESRQPHRIARRHPGIPGSIPRALDFAAPRARSLKAVQPGGSASGFILPEHVDTPLEYKALYEKEGALGSATMLVLDDTTCIVDVVKCLMYFFQHESCGFCLPCRRGTRVLYELVCQVIDGKGEEADLDRLVKLSKTMVDSTNCALGWSPYSFLNTTINRFRDEWLAHAAGNCPTGVCTAKAHAAAH